MDFSMRGDSQEKRLLLLPQLAELHILTFFFFFFFTSLEFFYADHFLKIYDINIYLVKIKKEMKWRWQKADSAPIFVMTVCHREEQVIMNSTSCTNCALGKRYARQCVRGSRGCKWGPLGSRAQGLVGRQALECICGRQLCFMRCVAQQVGDKSGKNHGCKYDECFDCFLSLLAFH